MKYKVIDNYGEEAIYDDVDEAINQCIEEDYYEDDGDFEDYVNDRFQGADIYGDYYDPYAILEALDRYSLDQILDEYREEKNDEDRERAGDDIDNGEVGDRIEVQNCIIELIADDDETTDEDYDTGDYDGDDVIDNLRVRLEHTKVQKEEEEENEKKSENDLMKMFQVIGR